MKEQMSKLLISRQLLAILRHVPHQGRLAIYLGVKAFEVFLCFVAVVRARLYYVDFFVFSVLHYW